MKKRIIAGLLAIVILCTVLGGCGGQKANSTDRNTPMSQESVVTEKNDTVIDSQTQSEIHKNTAGKDGGRGGSRNDRSVI